MDFKLTVKLVQVRGPKLASRACGATRKNFNLVFQPFTIPYGHGVRVSQAVATFSVSLAQRWAIRYPVRPPHNSFVAVVAYRSGPIIKRLKLWKDVGEICDFPLYLGETVESNAQIEIWTVPDRTLTLPFIWRLPLAMLELPKTVCDQDGTDLATNACIVPYPQAVPEIFNSCAI